ncbi:ATP-binding protein [Calothrix sp. PCC 7507]|uniref:ATP-binding protein n=1 Tax=Calothrix sp. PCC 7507 TaxID=99598 RepID=UPI00029EECF2|nr:ATP-binding protein [Calothrix sp. PCC 7507]AFY32231.1 integral membrane sensor signal transduction histidine kinase [Calothrix sp. PCC 7507]
MPHLRSFRLRIALLFAMLAGAALAGFGSISWWLIYEAKVSRLNAKLEALLIRPRPLVNDIWQSYENLLSFELGIDGETPIALLVIDKDGKTVYQSDRWSADFNLNGVWPPRPQLLPMPFPPPNFTTQQPPERPPFRLDRPLNMTPPRPRLVTQRTTAGTWRIGAIALPQFQVAIAVSLDGINREMNIIRDVFMIAIPVVLLLITGSAWWLSYGALRPVRQLVIAIRQVTVKGLDQRVPTTATDTEFLELIQVFNQMLERLERSFKQASRFSGDAAHELKTPLAILQGELEQTLQNAEPGSEIQQTFSNLLDEVCRLSGIVRKLSLLSLADAGQMSLYRVEVNLSDILAEMLEDMELLAPHLEVQAEIVVALRVKGDRDLLTQVLQNLFSNAIKYNVPDGWLRIHGRQQGKTVLVTISNSSQDIPDSDRDRIFDRFYRGDPARTRKVEGTGLGLSLAREITIAHDGKLTLDCTPPNQTAFTLSLPIY